MGSRFQMLGLLMLYYTMQEESDMIRENKATLTRRVSSHDG